MKIVSVPLDGPVHEALRERAKLQRRSMRAECAALLAEIVIGQFDPMMKIKLLGDPRAIR